MNRTQRIMILLCFVGCGLTAGAEETLQKSPAASRAEGTEIPALIEQLVFAHPKATDSPLYSPLKGINDDDPEYKKQFDKCGQAFRKLSEIGESAIPLLVAHFGDQRPSIPFRNHAPGHSVGDACYWNVYLQLTDQPRGYSSYGLMRQGKDGESHQKPYWAGTPFDEAGGLAAWLTQNRALSYHEKQIKCLNWLLAGEKAIGACDAESYFMNILPLEIRILERKQDSGADVSQELARLRKIRDDKAAEEIPPELLPQKSGKK